MKNSIKIIAIIFLSVSVIKPQQSRLNSLGGMSFSVKDVDSQLDPFNFGGNPAWISEGQKSQRLEIVPSSVFGWGSYHRYFDPDGITNYGASFSGIKPLGKSGTFKGTAVYQYLVRRGNNRALTYQPYSGSGYFFTDTTSGNFRYNGPTFEFLHGLEIYKNVFFGAAVDYQILDGLKNIYTYAQTLYRNVSGKIGLAYRFNDNFVLGFYYSLFDAQERIEASDINLLTVRTFLYRGEKYKIELRGTHQDFKIKNDGKSFNFQVFTAPLKNLRIGIKALYSIHRSRYLFPRNNLIDDEDGYTSYGESEVMANARYFYSKRLTLGFSAGYFDGNSWTKNSKRDLLIWKWKLKDAHFGLGLSFLPFRNNILFAAEYEGHFVSADSMKYIDHITNTLSALNNRIRLGVEIPLTKKLTLRFGYNYLHLAHDFVYGFDDSNVQLFVSGLALKISDVFQIEPQVTYSYKKSGENISREEFGAFIYLRFFQF